ncbi:MAG: hypothetical protein JSR81_12280 [Proteobacteria bacterium]|nr:hypothetical protein [Pseudomonadota bacterium]
MAPKQQPAGVPDPKTHALGLVDAVGERFATLVDMIESLENPSSGVKPDYEDMTPKQLAINTAQQIATDLAIVKKAIAKLEAPKATLGAPEEALTGPL